MHRGKLGGCLGSQDSHCTSVHSRVLMNGASQALIGLGRGGGKEGVLLLFLETSRKKK